MIEVRPYCHGEPMIPTYRYKAMDGFIYRVFTCGFCGEKEEIRMAKETVGQEILRKRRDRGDIEQDGLIYTKRGYNK